MSDPSFPGSWEPPVPADSAFIAKVRFEMFEAKRRCYDILGLKIPKRAVRPKPYGPRLAPAPVNVRRQSHKCRGCGGHLDEITPGCNACSGRHSMRRSKARRSLS